MPLHQPKLDNPEDLYVIRKYREEIVWLQEPCYEPGLMNLLNEFKGEDQRELLSELLKEMKHQTIAEKIQDISFLVDTLESLKLTASDTLIVATAKKSESDGSNAWLYFFKFYLAQHREWNERTLKPTIESSIETITNSPKKYKNIIIFDDFIGTGKTMTEKVREFEDKLKEKNLKLPNIHIFSLAGMKFGVSHAEKELNLNITCSTQIEKGISDKYTCPNEVDNRKALMVSMESILKSKYSHNAFTGKYSLGYEGSEALFQVQFTNCPNNVFPIFWMQPRTKGMFRNTLFYRL